MQFGQPMPGWKELLYTAGHGTQALQYATSKPACVSSNISRQHSQGEPAETKGIDRQTDRQTDRQAGRQTGTQAGRQAGRQAGCQTDRQTDYRL